MSFIRVICECGVNWRDFDEALLMVKKAKDAGCWAAKFQVFGKDIADEANLSTDLCLSLYEMNELMKQGKKEGIEVFFTPMYLEAVDMCVKSGARYCKIRYSDAHNERLLFEIIDKNMLRNHNFERVFVSTDGYLGYGLSMTRFLCVPKYPADLNDYLYRLRDLEFMRGISDHTSTLSLLKIMDLYLKENKWDIPFYFEKHVKLDDDCIESKWSVTFEQLAEVLKP